MFKWRLKKIRKIQNKAIQNNSFILFKKTKFIKPFLLLLPSIIVLLLFTVVPFVYVIVDSFLIQGDSIKITDINVGLKNYEFLLKSDYEFQIALRNTIIYALVALPISLFISIGVSITISNLTKRYWKSFWQSIFFLPYVTSGVAISIAFFYLFADKGIMTKILGLETYSWLTQRSGWNSLIVIILRGVWENLAFQILMLSTALMSINPMLYKASQIDGVSKTRELFAITLPKVKRTLLFLITIGIIGGVKIFPLALFDNNPTQATSYQGQTIMTYIYSMLMANKEQFKHYSTTASVILFILGVFLSFAIRYIVILGYRINIHLGVKRVQYKIKNNKNPYKTNYQI
ncbi:carbohydrate ABC transporter permease [Mycoplasma phocoenae]|uniref:Sugar ABC transporter permease n=1 Tax=Mycoplasma phocoenae TaxID=754517 RepID=A0A858U6N2_9MOLU|nr:sugar ABC transporter permease [Mycoplasma phocoenae]QJG66925.1 sugar ABC transporter permease [Mycoplasma phocoenae]